MKVQSLFSNEQKVYNKNISLWKKLKMQGLFVIIKNNVILGYAGTMEQAYEKGLSIIGNQTMYIKEVK